VFKALVFTRGEIRTIRVFFENNVPIAVMENGSQLPLDAALLRHVEQDRPDYYYRLPIVDP
jgi:hypothetical protein